MTSDMKKAVLTLLAAATLTGCAVSAPAPTAPETTEVTEALTEPATEAPTEAPAAPAAPVVTKDPTGEKLSPGGKTWFVAHADV